MKSGNEDLKGKIAQLTLAARDPAADTVVMLIELHDAASRRISQMKESLLGTALEWTGEQRKESAWIAAMQRRLAGLSKRIASAIAIKREQPVPIVCAAVSLALYYQGEAVKCAVSSGASEHYDYRAMHGLMRLAMATGRHRDSLCLMIEGRETRCTIEGLYFRALCLARFASGHLSAKQIEILDTWIWMWLPDILAQDTAPQTPVLRADLDSDHGLMRGPRSGRGQSLYVPQALIAHAYASLLEQFHRGNIVPADRLSSTFRIEDHVVVLDVIRRVLRESQRAPVKRARRRASQAPGQLYVGLTEIMAQSLQPRPRSTAALVLASVHGRSVHGPRGERMRDEVLPALIDPARRHVSIVDESDTGFGVDATATSKVCVGDLVSLCLDDAAPALCRVVRTMPGAEAGSVRIGLRRLTSRVVVTVGTVTDERGSSESPLLFLLGAGNDGRQDGVLVAESDFARRGRLAVSAGGRHFALTLNRVRARGRGWVLAGFEVAQLQTTPRCESRAINRR